VLEQEYPWLRRFKGMLRKKDGASFNIPEGRKFTMATPKRQMQSPASPAETSTPNPEEREKEKKQKSDSPMKKLRKEDSLDTPQDVSVLISLSDTSCIA